MFDPAPAPELQAEGAPGYTARTWAPRARSMPSPVPSPGRIPPHRRVCRATSREEKHTLAPQLLPGSFPKTPTEQVDPAPTGFGCSDDIAQLPGRTSATNQDRKST